MRTDDTKRHPSHVGQPGNRPVNAADTTPAGQDTSAESPSPSLLSTSGGSVAALASKPAPLSALPQSASILGPVLVSLALLAVLLLVSKRK